jgi:bifunctional non-homologous end joining protein LigD
MGFAPMLAHATSVLPDGPGWRFEPKYDGMRVIALGTATVVRLLSRDGNDKARQFPEIVAALVALRATVGIDFVLDTELVAVASDGYAGFQTLQCRINLEKTLRLLAVSRPAALVAFDLLALGSESLLARPLAERRRLLAALLAGRTGAQLRIARHGANGQRMLAYAVRRNLEGVVAKRDDSPYQADERSRHWLKHKLTRRQEFVVGGYTESSSREYFGALLLGYYDGDRLVYAGAVGSGFSVRSLADTYATLSELQPAICPFSQVPVVKNPHWTRPTLVVEVMFEQWSDEGRIRCPRFAGLRTDKRARDVVREEPEP